MYVGDEIVGSLIIWGNNFHEADLPACKVFGGQIATMLEKSLLYESELIKTQSLIKANALLRALNSLSTKITSTSEVDEVYDILGKELKELGYKCMVTLLESDRKTGYFHYTTETKKIRMIENLLGIEVHGRRFQRNNQDGGTLWIHNSNGPRFVTNFYSHLSRLFPQVPKVLKQQALSLIDIQEDSKAMFLPLNSTEGPVGSLTIWGEMIEEESLPIFKIFADQIANMLEKTRLGEAERKHAQDLAHSYSLVNALSDLSVKLTSTTNSNELFEILGRELRKLDYYLHGV